MRNSNRLTKQQRKQHKQARSLRQCSRGKAWQAIGDQDTGKRKQWEVMA